MLAIPICLFSKPRVILLSILLLSGWSALLGQALALNPAIPQDNRFLIKGQVLSATGEPVADLRVDLDAYPEGGKADFLQRWGLDSSSFEVRTDRSGHFRFESLPPCFYQLRLPSPVQGPPLQRQWLDSDQDWFLRLKPRLRIAGQASKSGPGEVKVTLWLGSHPKDGDDHDFFDFRVEATTTADAGGRYEFNGLQPGWYVITASAPGCGFVREVVELAQSREEVNFALRQGFEFEGKIVPTFPIHPGSARAYLSPRPPSDRLFAGGGDGEGNFHFEGLPAGIYELSVEATEEGRRGKSIRRTFQIDLTKSVLDYTREISNKTHRLQIHCDVPSSDGFVDGILSARGPQGILEKTVRVTTIRGSVRHQVWTDTSRVLSPSASYLSHPAFPLDLPPGPWDLRLELSGYHPWSIHLDPDRDRKLEANLKPQRGRVVNVRLDSKVYLVESRPSGKEEQPWTILCQRRANYRPILKVAPLSAWLPAGHYDLRSSTMEKAEHVARDLEIAPLERPLVLSPTMEKGYRIEGQFSSNAAPGVQHDLHLFRQEEGGRWRRLPTKRSSLHWNQETLFSFGGLHPGVYRATADQAGEVLVAEWQLGDRDLLGVVIDHEYR